MNNEVWIIGKDLSIDTYPDDFFKDKFTIGINHTALTFKTNFAFSSYYHIIELLIKSGFLKEKIISLDQLIKEPPYWPNGKPRPSEFSGLTLPKLRWNNSEQIPINKITFEMHYLIKTKDKNFYWHNLGTAVQMVIYWCILNSYYPINLAGCNQSTNCSKKVKCDCMLDNGKTFCVPLDYWDRSKKYTREVIRCLNVHGDYVRFYEDYQDYLNRRK